MKPVRLAARSMLAWMFVREGLAAVRAPEEKVDAAKPVLDRLSPTLPWLPKDPKTFVRVTGAVQLTAAAALAAGKFRRPAALALAGSILVTGGGVPHGNDPADRARFEKDIALLGGLLLAAVDTQGRPSLGWRARRAAKAAKGAGESAGKATKKAAKSANKSTKKAAKSAREATLDKLPG
jgi:putative oxidoreductase